MSNRIEHFLYFASQEEAEAAEVAATTSLSPDWFREIVVRRSAHDPESWLLLARHSRKVSMAQSTMFLQQLAAKHNGEYDGWGESV